MLGENYLTVDGVGYTPSTFGYEIQTVENVNQSEAGTDLATIVRFDKHVFTATWEGIDAELLAELEDMCKKPVVTVVYREQSYTCRARDISPAMLNKTYKYRHSDGLWNASVKFTQI